MKTPIIPILVNDNDARDNERLKLFQSPEQVQYVSRQAKASNLLTSRQRDVFECVVKGMDTKSIARHIRCAPGTVKTHLAIIYSRLGVANRIILLSLLGGSDDTWEPWKHNIRSGEYMAAQDRSKLTWGPKVKD